MDRTGEAWGWRAYWPAISWSSIFAGWLFAWAFAMLLYALGAAVGITTMAAINDFSAGVAIGTGVWIVLSWIAATFFGGWLAARLAGRPNQGVGAMHGMVVWSLCAVMTLIVVQVQAAGAVSAGTQAAQGAAQAVQAGVLPAPEAGIPDARVSDPSAAGEPEGASADRDAEAIRRALLRFDDGDLNQFRTSIAEGRSDEVRRLLGENTDLEDAQISQVIANLSGEGAPPSGERAAEQAGDVTSGAMWVLFLTSLFGLAAGVAGGMLGARRSEEFYAELTAAAPPVPQPQEEYAGSRRDREEEAAERW